MIPSVLSRCFSSQSVLKGAMTKIVASPSLASFRLFKLHDALISNLVKTSILVPTEIQSKSFEHIRQGKSAILLSETGSGKTLAYILPLISRLLDRPSDPSSNPKTGPRMLLIMPTPELARQTSSFVERICAETAITHTCIPSVLDSKITLPRNTDVLVTTFRALEQLSHLTERLFAETEAVVIDESDWVLGEGYSAAKAPWQTIKQLKTLKLTDGEYRNGKQFVFVCATLPPGVKSVRTHIVREFPSIPVVFSSGTHQTVKSVRQNWVNFDQETEEERLEAKLRELVNIIKEDSIGGKILVFGNTTNSIDKAHAAISEFVASNPNIAARYQVDKLHHKSSRKDKEEILPMFVKYQDSSKGDVAESDKQTHILVAGDMVARGYDFQQVSKVIQFDFASNVVTYLHRVGRTARAGNEGEVINFLESKDSLISSAVQNAADRLTVSETMEDVDATSLARCFSRNRSLRTRERRKDLKKKYPTSAALQEQQQ